MVTVNSERHFSTVQNSVIQSAAEVLNANFALVLQSLLDEQGRTKSELYNYIFQQGCQIDQAAMYRYFNPRKKTSRIPAGSKGKHFLDLFAAFLNLSPHERAALILVWRIQRQQCRKNGANQI